MNIIKSREQELAYEQLLSITPLVKIARRLFIAHEALVLIGSTSYFEDEINNASYALSTSILALERNLKFVISEKSMAAQDFTKFL